MKHCPNTECPGLEKFGMVSEFNDTSTVCADCGAALVDGPAPDTLSEGGKPDPNMELVAVIAVTSEPDIVMVESLLQDAGVRYLARGEQIQDLFGLGRLTAVNPLLEPVEFLVAEADVEVARSVLADLNV